MLPKVHQQHRRLLLPQKLRVVRCPPNRSLLEPFSLHQSACLACKNTCIEKYCQSLDIAQRKVYSCFYLSFLYHVTVRFWYWFWNFISVGTFWNCLISLPLTKATMSRSRKLGQLTLIILEICNIVLCINEHYQQPKFQPLNYLWLSMDPPIEGTESEVCRFSVLRCHSLSFGPDMCEVVSSAVMHHWSAMCLLLSSLCQCT